LVEAAIRGRRAVGIDVDPVAVEVAEAKTRRYDLREVEQACQEFLSAVAALERPAAEYERLMFADISEEEFSKTVADDGLWIPAIPRLNHWFRRYVTVDLARILIAAQSIRASPRTRLLLRIIFASTIRNASNADPVPVSGLEYTAYMKRRDAAGRLVNPFALLRTAVTKTKRAVNEYVGLLGDDATEPECKCGDAMALPERLDGLIDAVITSPPYHNAVDYYRRHQLEMFWLGHTDSQAARELLLPRYVGRPNIAAKDPLLALPWNPRPLTSLWERRIRATAPRRADDLRHYVQAMTRCFEGLARAVRPGGPMLMVVGHSSWNGDRIPTGKLFAELATDFTLQEVLYYPVKNRYMSYTRHNHASIDKEYVLAFTRN
jgi:hypothetical protein